jgi:maleamate amidohydrolase
VRATVVDSLSRSLRNIVPEECVSDKHESPHFANLYDMAVKYADVVPVAEVEAYMRQYKPAN